MGDMLPKKPYNREEGYYHAAATGELKYKPAKPYKRSERYWECIIERIGEGGSQTKELPEPTKDNEGKIYQYVGETTGDYVNGYFYKNVYNEETGKYAWVQSNTQPAGSGGTPTWGEITQKPFSRIGEGLVVEDDVLKAIGGAGGDVHYVDELPETGDNSLYVVKGPNEATVDTIQRVTTGPEMYYNVNEDSGIGVSYDEATGLYTISIEEMSFNIPVCLMLTEINDEIGLFNLDKDTPGYHSFGDSVEAARGYAQGLIYPSSVDPAKLPTDFYLKPVEGVKIVASPADNTITVEDSAAIDLTSDRDATMTLIELIAQNFLVASQDAEGAVVHLQTNLINGYMEVAKICATAVGETPFQEAAIYRDKWITVAKAPDSQISFESSNAVQNRVLAKALDTAGAVKSVNGMTGDVYLNGYNIEFVAKGLNSMPNPETQEEGTIVQFIGESDPMFTSGYFYKVGRNEMTKELEWQRIDVQPGGEAGGVNSVNGKTGDVYLEAEDVPNSGLAFYAMPEPEPKYYGRIAQYIGETSESYVKSAFYECRDEGGVSLVIEQVVGTGLVSLDIDEETFKSSYSPGVYQFTYHNAMTINVEINEGGKITQATLSRQSKLDGKTSFGWESAQGGYYWTASEKPEPKDVLYADVDLGKETGSVITGPVSTSGWFEKGQAIDLSSIGITYSSSSTIFDGDTIEVDYKSGYKWVKIQGGGESGYEPDNETIRLNSDNELMVMDYLPKSSLYTEVDRLGFAQRTLIPTVTSQLYNDSDFAYNKDLDNKQNKITSANAGDGIDMTFDESGNLDKINSSIVTYEISEFIKDEDEQKVIPKIPVETVSEIYDKVAAGIAVRIHFVTPDRFASMYNNAYYDVSISNHYPDSVMEDADSPAIYLQVRNSYLIRYTLNGKSYVHSYLSHMYKHYVTFTSTEEIYLKSDTSKQTPFGVRFGTLVILTDHKTEITDLGVLTQFLPNVVQGRIVIEEIQGETSYLGMWDYYDDVAKKYEYVVQKGDTVDDFEISVGLPERVFIEEDKIVDLGAPESEF